MIFETPQRTEEQERGRGKGKGMIGRGGRGGDGKRGPEGMRKEEERERKKIIVVGRRTAPKPKVLHGTMVQNIKRKEKK